MKAVILAAGEGGRLQPFTATRPKVMIPVGNKPILEYVVDALRASGITEIIIVVGYRRETIMDYFGDGRRWGVGIAYVDQPRQLGTAHALLLASRMIDDRFLVINGDTIIDVEAIGEVMAATGDAAMLTVTVPRARAYGVVRARNRRVEAILEKPRGEDGGNIVNAGVYCFSPRIFGFLESTGVSERGEYEITDAIRKMIGEGLAVTPVQTSATWMDALHVWGLVDMNAAAVARREPAVRGRAEDGARLIGPVTVGENSVIRSGSYVVGPVAIGDGCDVGPNAVILPGTSIGSNCTVGPFTRIADSLVMKNVKLASFNDISRSILGDGVSTGSNFIAEAGPARVQDDDAPARATVGVAIGDDAEIAARVTAVPGTIIGARCRIGPGVIVRESLPDGTRIA